MSEENKESATKKKRTINDIIRDLGIKCVGDMTPEEQADYFRIRPEYSGDETLEIIEGDVVSKNEIEFSVEKNKGVINKKNRTLNEIISDLGIKFIADMTPEEKEDYFRIRPEFSGEEIIEIIDDDEQIKGD